MGEKGVITVGRKIRCICELCGERVMPGKRTMHLKDKHPDVTPDYRKHFSFDVIENYKRTKPDVKTEKAKKTLKTLKKEKPEVEPPEKLK